MSEFLDNYVVGLILAAPFLVGLVVVGFHVALCVIVGIGAGRRRRDSAGWGVFAFFASPLVAGFSLLMLGSKPREQQQSGDQP